MHNLRDKTLTGLKWSGAGQVIRQILQSIIQVFLARILSPNDFGLLGMILVFTGFAEIFRDLGLGSAIIQKQEITTKHLSSIFLINILAGLILTIIFIACAPLIALFYKQPTLKNYIAVLAINFFISSFSIVPRALIHKSIKIKQIVFIESAAVLTSGTVAILMALNGLGIWSIVTQTIINSLIISIAVWRLSEWFPTLYCNFKEIRDFIHYGMNLLGFNILNYWVRNFDNLLVGKYISSIALGIYTRAYGLMLLPINQISSVLSRVMFPSLSLIQKDKVKVKRVYLTSCRTIALISFPLMIGLLATARPFIITVYGRKWEEVIPILQILCLTGMSQSIGNTVGWIYSSQGRTDVQFKWGALSGVVYISAFIIGLRWGIRGIAIAYALTGCLVLWYPAWSIPGKLIDLSFLEMLRNLSGVFLCAITMGLLVWILGFCFSTHLPIQLLLFSQTIFGILVYLLLIRVFNLTAYRETREIIHKSYLFGISGKQLFKWL